MTTTCADPHSLFAVTSTKTSDSHRLSPTDLPIGEALLMVKVADQQENISRVDGRFTVAGGLPLIGGFEAGDMTRRSATGPAAAAGSTPTTQPYIVNAISAFCTCRRFSASS